MEPPQPADTWEEGGEWQGEAVLRHRQQGLTLTAIWETETNTQHNRHHKHKHFQHSTELWVRFTGRQYRILHWYSMWKSCSHIAPWYNKLCARNAVLRKATCKHSQTHKVHVHVFEIQQPMLIVLKQYIGYYISHKTKNDIPSLNSEEYVSDDFMKAAWNKAGALPDQTRPFKLSWPYKSLICWLTWQ